MNNIPENLRLGGGASSSTMHPVVMIILVVALLLMFALPRRYVCIPFLGAIFLTPFGQQLYVGGVHLFLTRILILAGWIRMGRTKTAGGMTLIDKVFLCWAIFRACATFLEFLQVQAVINQVAFLWDSIGCYFLLRRLVRDDEDVIRVIKTLAFIVFLLSVAMINEKTRNENLFGYMGGRLTPFIRDGATRAQGPFVGPIPAGTFGATLLCMFIWLWRQTKEATSGLLGVIGSTIMVLTSASSTPLMAFAAGILGIAMWPARAYMRTIRWGIVGMLALLQCVMKAPVWMIINHIDLVGGNSAYHRAMLVDGFMRHFSDWWLIGVKSTWNWGWDMWDQANQFVAEGESGGLATFVAFVLLVSWSFGRLGRAVKEMAGNPKKEWLCWLFGATLFSYVISFFGISFSDQSVVGWYALLSMTCIATIPALKNSTRIDTNQTSGLGTRDEWAYSLLSESAWEKTAKAR